MSFLIKAGAYSIEFFVAYKPGTRLEKTAFSLSYSVNFALMTPHVFLLFLHFIFLFICLFQTISNELQLLKLQIYFLGYSFSERFISMFEKCGEKREIKFVQAFYCACQEFNCLLLMYFMGCFNEIAGAFNYESIKMSCRFQTNHYIKLTGLILICLFKLMSRFAEKNLILCC